MKIKPAIKMNDHYILKTLAAGWISGMRSVSALAFTSNLIHQHQVLLPLSKPLRILANPIVSKTIHGLAAGEFVGDKLPETPDRVAPAPLTARTLMGAISGAVIYTLAKKSPFTGALVGGLTAIVSSYAMYNLRKELRLNSNVPDATLGFAEDALVTGALFASRKK
ncbi:DUF4126 family protein [Pedobacter sp.]|uniref:DUF4126 family protein n=1 Tax=Pedobacter sp. TaxID=1411316 RepID=UPI003D7F26BF